jgi:hypothetical protein
MIVLLEIRQPAMRVLYVIFVLCVAALLFTALAAARHIIQHEKLRNSTLHPPPADETAAKSSEILVSAGKTPGE